MSHQLAVTKALKKDDVDAFHQFSDDPANSLDQKHKWLTDRGYKVCRSAVRIYCMRRQGMAGNTTSTAGIMRDKLKGLHAASAWAMALSPAEMEHLRFFMTNNKEGALWLEFKAAPFFAKPL